MNDDARLPGTDALQLNREHRLYQADWLLRFYRFDVTEIIDEKHPFLDPEVDPKANWALNHLDFFPVEVNKAPLDALLRVPGIGVKGARSIVRARRTTCLREQELRKLGIAYKRARFFITCNGSYAGQGADFSREGLRAQLVAPIEGGKHGRRADKTIPGQMSLFDSIETPEKKRIADGAARARALDSGPASRRGLAQPTPPTASAPPQPVRLSTSALPQLTLLTASVPPQPTASTAGSAPSSIPRPCAHEPQSRSFPRAQAHARALPRPYARAAARRRGLRLRRHARRAVHRRVHGLRPPRGPSGRSRA